LEGGSQGDVEVKQSTREQGRILEPLGQ
jgi:hypothetical protein